MALGLITVATLGCDQATKHLAAAHLAGAPRLSYLGDTVRLQYVENPGAFLGLGAGLPGWARTGLFVGGTALLLLGMAVAYMRGPWTTTQRLGLGWVVAGGLSNLVDRVLRGSVPDFLNVGVGGLRTGIFNVADMAILLGFVLAVVSARRSAGREGRAAG